MIVNRPMLVTKVVIKAKNKARTKNGKMDIKPVIIEKILNVVHAAATFFFKKKKKKK
jgi:hypothetical protein